MSKDKSPPLLSSSRTYDDWLKLIKLWQGFTTLEKGKQASAIVLSLDGKAQDAALKIPTEDLIKDDGVETLIKRLDTIFKKDALTQQFVCLENFENFRRSDNSSVKSFIEEFDKKYYKVKAHNLTYSEDVLGFRLLKAANLSSRDEQLVKATVSEIKYGVKKEQLKKIFSEQEISVKTIDDIKVKSEPTLHTSCSNENHNYEEVNDGCSDLCLDPIYEMITMKRFCSPIIVEVIVEVIVVTSVETQTTRECRTTQTSENQIIKDKEHPL